MPVIWKPHALLAKFICVLGMTMALVACGGSSDGSSDSGTTATPILTGLWIGVTEENTGTSTTPTEWVTYVLFDQDVVYVLREDEALLGTYTIEDNDLSTFTMDVYPYANPDTDNEFYVGTDDTNDLLLSALQATSSKYVINYNNATRAGRIDVNLDTAQVTDLSINTVIGTVMVSFPFTTSPTCASTIGFCSLSSSSAYKSLVMVTPSSRGGSSSTGKKYLSAMS